RETARRYLTDGARAGASDHQIGAGEPELHAVKVRKHDCAQGALPRHRPLDPFGVSRSRDDQHLKIRSGAELLACRGDRLVEMERALAASEHHHGLASGLEPERSDRLFTK